MGRAIAYMLTWGTYGTWLQGDRRGWVKDGRRYGEDRGLYEANLGQIHGRAMRFAAEEKEAVRKALAGKAMELGQEVPAIAVFSNHVHIVLSCVDRPMSSVVQMYKRAATMALRRMGVQERVWARGYSVRYCFDGEAVRGLVEYVLGHEDERDSGIACGEGE